MTWLYSTPLPLILLVLIVLLLAAQEGGHRLHAIRMLRERETDGEGSGHLLSAALALLGLLIGFTFAMAANRYETRREYVTQEAAAMETAYRNIQLLHDPARSDLRRLMLQWTTARLEFFAARRESAELARADAATDAIAGRMWTIVSAEVAARPQDATSQIVPPALSAMFEAADRDRAALNSYIPATIEYTVIAYAAISATIMGFVLAANKRRYALVSSTVFILVALAITLILDLDRPRTGSVSLSTEPFLRADREIRASEAARPPRPVP